MAQVSIWLQPGRQLHLFFRLQLFFHLRQLIENNLDDDDEDEDDDIDSCDYSLTSGNVWK